MPSSSSVTEYFKADNKELYKDKSSVDEYYDHITHGLGISVRYQGEPRGKGLFATRPFVKGERILIEQGMISIQSEDNKVRLFFLIKIKTNIN